MVDLAALKVELDTDPKTLGLPALDNRLAADKLNKIGASSEELGNDVLESYQVVDAIDPTEWAAISAQEKERLLFIISAGKINPKNINVKQAFMAMFGAGTTTRASLSALWKKDVSRAQILFGQNVTAFQVRDARSL